MALKIDSPNNPNKIIYLAANSCLKAQVPLRGLNNYLNIYSCLREAINRLLQTGI